jgi:carbonic anhydrase
MNALGEGGDTAARRCSHIIGISDPHRAFAYNVAALQANPNLPAGLTVTGVIYDVATGRADTVVESVQFCGAVA